MSAPPSFQGGGYANITGDRFGSVTNVSPQYRTDDFATNRGFELSLSTTAGLTSGLAMGIYTTIGTMSGPTWFLFES
ncbi:hypothetical protein PQR34_47550, partial [Paraburkholderia sediminicola]|uniref:hypothetical protein n=1 Tax=Paraburkholderia sediminicola TaxID=458836 RepID=UPI0038B6BF9F